jgi:CTP:molybdopterin cytidylyltransferase MocA
LETIETGVVILAAGKSERMKELKAFLSYDDDTLFIEKIISTFSHWGCSEIVIVTNKEAFQKMKQTVMDFSNTTIVLNDHVEYERFYSVKLGLGVIGKSSFCFIQNVDNPLIDAHILDLIYQRKSYKKYVSPVFKKKGGHPILLNRDNISRICNWKENSDNLKEVLNTMECLMVEMPDDRVLVNINNPDDYHKYFTMERKWN